MSYVYEFWSFIKADPAGAVPVILFWLVVGAAAFVAAVYATFILIGWGRNLFPKQVNINKSGPETARTLVVLAHGIGFRGYRKLDGVAGLASHESTAVWRLSYDLNFWTNQDHHALAGKIADALEAEDLDRFDEIILLGYSCGALLARSAFLYAKNESYRPAGTGAYSWHKKVNRIVLMAGVNAGWSRYFVKFMGLPLFGLSASIGRFFRVASACYGIERGTPFIERLRLEQLREHDNEDFPHMIQIVGTKDGIVDAKTEMDLAVMGPRTHFLLINGTRHFTFTDVTQQHEIFEDAHVAPGTRADFRRKRAEAVFFALFGALGDGPGLPAATDRNWQVPLWLREALLDPKNEIIRDKRIKRAVIVLHGIRDDGHWAERFRLFIEDAMPDPYVMVLSPSFGRFSIANLMIPFIHRRNFPERWFATTCVDIQARYPEVKHIDFIGHSFGTYVFANVLRRYQLPISFGNVYLAGSVLPRNFPWEDILARKLPDGRPVLGRLANATATNDWIVAIGPGSYQAIVRLLVTLSAPFRRIRQLPRLDQFPGGQLISDFFALGDAGVSGFNCKTVDRVHRLDGGHGAFNERTERIQLAAEYVSRGPSKEFGKLKDVVEAERQGLRPGTALISRVSIAMLLTLIVVAVYALTWLISGLLEHVFGFASLPIYIPLAAALVIVYFVLEQF